MEKTVFIDSSCWIDFFRGTDSDLVTVMSELVRNDFVIAGGPIFIEVLGACQFEKERKEIESLFNELPFLELSKQDFMESVTLKQKLRKQGVQVGSMDLLIAHLAIKSDSFLLHRDDDYNHIARSCKELQIHPFSLKK